MAKIKLSITGQAEIKRKLDKLGQIGSKKVVVKAMRTAMKPLLAYTRKQLPKKTGLVRRSLKLKAPRRTRKKGIFRLLMVIGDADFQGKSFYAAFLEYGKKLGKAKRGTLKNKLSKAQKLLLNKGRKQIAGKYYLKKAWDTKQNSVQQRFISELKTAILNI